MRRVKYNLKKILTEDKQMKLFPDEPRFEHDSESGEFLGHHDISYKHPKLGKRTSKSDVYIYSDQEDGNHTFAIRHGDHRNALRGYNLKDIHRFLESDKRIPMTKGYWKDLLQSAEQGGHDTSLVPPV